MMKSAGVSHRLGGLGLASCVGPARRTGLPVDFLLAIADCTFCVLRTDEVRGLVRSFPLFYLEFFSAVCSPMLDGQRQGDSTLLLFP